MLDKLEFLIALAGERHFRRAAERVGVSQPTLSAGIKALEETLGVALVNRGARYVGLTPEGERVLEWARRLVGDARAMRQDVDALKRGVAGEVRLGVSVGRKVGGAVERNKVKRAMREAFWSLSDRLPPGHDFVLVGRSGVAELVEREGATGLKGSIGALLDEAGSK